MRVFTAGSLQLLWLGRAGGGGGGGGGGVLPSAAKMRRGVRKVFPVSKRKETVCGSFSFHSKGVGKSPGKRGWGWGWGWGGWGLHLTLCERRVMNHNWFLKTCRKLRRE